MLPPPRHSVNKVFGLICRLEANLILEILRLAAYIGFAVAVFGFFYWSNRLQMGSKIYFAGDQVVYTSEIRGLFPPIQGSALEIEGHWRVALLSSLENEDSGAYREYTLEFKEKQTSKLRVKREGCNGDYMMVWRIYSYNMVIDEFRGKLESDDMVITANVNDTKCIFSETSFFDLLQSVSVWTIEDGRLFLLVERGINRKTLESVFILEKA